MKDLYRGHRSMEIALILLYIFTERHDLVKAFARDFAVNDTVKVGC